MTGASAGNVNRAFARASSSTSRSVARAGIWRMRGCCTGPVENPSFHVRSPSSNASNNVGATGVVTAVDSSVRVRVIIVTLLLESGVSRKRNKLTRVLQRLHSFFRRGYLTQQPCDRRRSLRQRLHEPHAGLLVADVAVEAVSLTAMTAAGKRDGHRALLSGPFLKSLHEK